MTEEIILSKKYKPFVLIPCACGCGELINKFDKRGRIVKFKKHHQNRRENHYNWKNGIAIDGFGYERELRPNHPYADSNGRVKRHRLVYEEYYNVCLLPWIDIDHINGIKNDNRIENLRPLSKSEHMRLHHLGSKFGICNRGRKRPFKSKPKKNMDGRACFNCLLSYTYKRIGGNFEWRPYLHMFLCKRCYNNMNNI